MSTPDFFRARLDAMIDMNHPLAILANRFPWSEMEAILSPIFARQERAGKMVVVDDWFGSTRQLAGGARPQAGRHRLPIRLMIALLLLKHTYNESDESVVERWGQDVYFQYFSGQDYFEARKPCDPTQISRFRTAIGEAGLAEILVRTVNTAVALKAITPNELETVIVDTTVQEKAMAHPTDSRLLEVARIKLVQQAKRAGISLKQTFQKEGNALRRKAGGYAHAKQFKRLKKTVNRQRTIVGKLCREIQRKMTGLSEKINATLTLWLERATRLVKQQVNDKNKLYALHAPEVECISKGKAKNRYEFGVKSSLAITHQKGLIVGAKTFPGNPYDGHSLAEQIEQTNIVLMDQNVTVKTVYADLGYRGVDESVDNTTLIHRGKINSLDKKQKKNLKRRQAIEPVIGHLKADHGMRRCWLKGEIGDALHSISCALGFNIRWLMRAIVRLGCKPFFVLIFLFCYLRHGLENLSRTDFKAA
jgi:transposase, IS5 family